MKLVYIAGPYRGLNHFETHRNINRAWEAAIAVIACPGCFPVVPHLNTAHMDESASPQYFLVGTLELMKRCDAVLLMEGWERSEGARAEYQKAKCLLMPIYKSIDALRKDGE